MLIACDLNTSLRARRFDRDDLMRKKATTSGVLVALLGPQRSGIAVRARHIKLARDVVAYFWVRVVTKQCAQPWIWETRTHGRIVHAQVSTIGPFGFGHDERGACHTLDAA